MKSLLHIREGRRLSRSRGRRIFVVIAIKVDIKEPHVGDSIQTSISRTKHLCRNQLENLFNKRINSRMMIHSL